MKNRVGGLTTIAALGALCFSSPLIAQDATVNFTGTINTQSFGGGYADPYAGTVTYNSSTLNSNGEIICDDYYDEIFIPETWKATVIQASSLTSTDVAADTLFGSTIGINGYAAVAGLVSQMLATNSQSTQDDLSAAIWWITSGGRNLGTSSSPDYVINGYTLDTNASSYVTSALATYGTLAAATSGQDTAAQQELEADTSLFVLNPVPGTQPQGDGRPQEMWITAPEGGATLLYLLLAGASCCGAILLSTRNRLGNRASA